MIRQHSYYIDSFKEDLVRNLKIDLYVESGFDDEQVQAVIDGMDSYGESLSPKVLSLCLSISYARASLVVNAPRHMRDASLYPDKKDLERWVGTAGSPGLKGSPCALPVAGKPSEDVSIPLSTEL